MREIKAVIDTNIIVSILKGKPTLSPIYTSFREGKILLVVNSLMLKEWIEVLSRPKLHIEPADIKELFKVIRRRAIKIKTKTPYLNICRAPQDNFILELAEEAKVDFVVTGDKDLLILESFLGVPIVTARQFLKILSKI